MAVVVLVLAVENPWAQLDYQAGPLCSTWPHLLCCVGVPCRLLIPQNAPLTLASSHLREGDPSSGPHTVSDRAKSVPPRQSGSPLLRAPPHEVATR